MANPLAPGVSAPQHGTQTSRTIPGPKRNGWLGNALPRPRPTSKQGNVLGGSDFPGKAQGNNAMGGDSESYRVKGTLTGRGDQHNGGSASNGSKLGFGAVKRPTTGQSPRGVFPARKAGNFGRV